MVAYGGHVFSAEVGGWSEGKGIEERGVRVACVAIAPCCWCLMHLVERESPPLAIIVCRRRCSFALVEELISCSFSLVQRSLALLVWGEEWRAAPPLPVSVAASSSSSSRISRQSFLSLALSSHALTPPALVSLLQPLLFPFPLLSSSLP